MNNNLKAKAGKFNEDQMITVEDHVIKSSGVEELLRVTIDSDLNFKEHIQWNPILLVLFIQLFSYILFYLFLYSFYYSIYVIYVFLFYFFSCIYLFHKLIYLFLIKFNTAITAKRQKNMYVFMCLCCVFVELLCIYVYFDV